MNSVRHQHRSRFDDLIGGLSLLSVGLLLACTASLQSEELVDFDREIRPLLSDACFQCHGPDGEQRQTDLRLDVRASVFGDLGESRVVVPGRPEQSELFRRITSNDPDVRMPPAESPHRLTASQIESIKRWIQQGAKWKEHWAFTSPIRPALPDVTNQSWVQNPIDHFVLSRLEQIDLTPNRVANKNTLIRRLSLDLTGLPPAPTEVAGYVADHGEDAYEKLVERLLASPRFGERMALPWLDAARYADTSGYQNDGPRSMWRWRDWVIDAFNQNVPYDQFTIEQLAGDMLPDADLSQRIASGFNRNHRGNAEGGIIPEEYAVEYVVDRVETTSTVWLGLTIGCARCHDHKFDPISQQEFYQFFDFFNNVPEFGRAVKEGNSPPYIKAPTDRQTEELKHLDRMVSEARDVCRRMETNLITSQTQWEQNVRSGSGESLPDWTPPHGLLMRKSLDDLPEGDDSAASVRSTTGKVQSAAHFNGSQALEVGDVGGFGYFDKFTIAAWIHPKANGSGQQKSIVSRVTDSARATGYSVTWKDGRIHVNLVKRWLDDSVRVHSKQLIPINDWTHVCVTYDGTRRASGISIFCNGRKVETEVELDLLNQSFAIAEPLRIGGGGGPEAIFEGKIDDVHLYDRVVSSEEVRILAAHRSIGDILTTAAASRSKGEHEKIRSYFLEFHASDDIRSAFQRCRDLENQRAGFWEAIPTVMVMQEDESPRATYILNRGQYDQPGKQVYANTPSCLPPLEAATADRLALAQWIASPENPLTARVAVNRYWQMLFGVGLVETTEDFGVQGMRPSHPDLLDWLAVEFVESGWDVKRLLKMMVMSATYRQSSTLLPTTYELDPLNRLLARGPRIRLPAELIRDQALAASGLLVDSLGGESVRPYQPKGLWKEIASDTDYDQATGEGLYRRSLYTYWKRTVAPPSMMVFDAAARETCTVRTSRTNTPLQALTLMNDLTFLDASRALAERVSSYSDNPVDGIRNAFQWVLARQPTSEELDVLERGWYDHRSRYEQEPKLIVELLRATRLSSVSDTVLKEGTPELAAYVVTCSLILNLDEFVIRE